MIKIVNSALSDEDNQTAAIVDYIRDPANSAT